MPEHTAKSLFDQNILSAVKCLELFDGVTNLRTQLDVSWLLRSVVVFSISAIDAYFHDKIRYRVSKVTKIRNEKFTKCPSTMDKIPIQIEHLKKWDSVRRKANVIRNFIVDYYSTRPLQKKDVIAEALKVVDIDDLWNQIEANNAQRTRLLNKLSEYVDRRNKIAHEGDREKHRSSGQRLRIIDRDYAQQCIDFVNDIVSRIEVQFPN